MNNYQIITDFEFVDEPTNEAQASLTANPTVSFAKFIFTDDKPNRNKQRIPKEEYPNILRTGINMPVKMASGAISDGHKGAIPIGVITHLKEENDVILGIAALWKKERPEEVALLRTMAQQNKHPQLSWELFYDDSKTDESGVEDLFGVIVGGTTVVGLPAYSGRTPILAMSSVKDNTVEDELKQKIADLEKELADARAALSEKDAELAPLKEYKAAIEQKELEAQKFASVKTKFQEAGIVRDESYFDSNKEKLLAMSEDALSFLVQEVAAFATLAPKTEASVRIPNIPAEKVLDVTKVSDAVTILKQIYK